MHTTLNEKYSFVRRTLVVLVAIVLYACAGSGPDASAFQPAIDAQSPFPSDRFTAFDSQQLTGLRVNFRLPNCATSPSDCADLTLLNQLDGFNLQPRLSIPFDGAIDREYGEQQHGFPVAIAGNAVWLRLNAHISNPHVIGINQIVWDPASLTLFAESNDHLDEDSNYLLIVTTGVHDASGNPIAAGSAFAQFIHGDGGVDGKNADRLLKGYQAALKHSLDNDVLKSIGISRDNVAAASVFTTESATATLRSIREQIKAAAAPTVNFNLGSGGEKTVFPLNTVTGLTWNVQALTVGPLIPTSLNATLGRLAGISRFHRHAGVREVQWDALAECKRFHSAGADAASGSFAGHGRYLLQPVYSFRATPHQWLAGGDLRPRIY